MHKVVPPQRRYTGPGVKKANSPKEGDKKGSQSPQQKLNLSVALSFFRSHEPRTCTEYEESEGVGGRREGGEVGGHG